MTTRADFLRAQNAGCRQGRPGVGLEICATPESRGRDGAARVGFTASRKVGGAVQRNRCKRRLRAAAASLLPLYGRERHDYVLVARTATLSRPFSALLADLQQALDAGHAQLDRKAQRNRGEAT
jgi:ribonuclease P protein component